MRPRDQSYEEARAEGERLKERLKQADREGAWYFVYMLSKMEVEDREAENREKPSNPE